MIFIIAYKFGALRDKYPSLDIEGIGYLTYSSIFIMQYRNVWNFTVSKKHSKKAVNQV